MTDRLMGLHVEDSIDVFYTLRMALEFNDCSLTLAIDRTQFLSEISKPFDFIVFDGCIPGWGHLDYIKDIRAYCKVPFFIYSGNSLGQLEPFRQIGADGVFEKRLGFKILCDCIYKHFDVAVKRPSKTTDSGPELSA